MGTVRDYTLQCIKSLVINKYLPLGHGMGNSVYQISSELEQTIYSGYSDNLTQCNDIMVVL